MSDRIIIVGIRRGSEKVPISEIVQMQGRCARTPGAIGYVDILVGEDDLEELKCGLADIDNLYVNSMMSDSETLAFHLVAEISLGRVSTLREAEEWYKKSFAHHVRLPVDLSEVMELLVNEWDAVIKRGPLFLPTQFAHLATRYYYHPADIFDWKENFIELFSSGRKNNDVALSWALSHVCFDKTRYNVYGSWEAIDEYKSQTASLGLDCTGSVAGGLIWWSILGGPPVGRLRSMVKTVREDFGRLSKVLMELNGICGWNQQKFFEDLKVRVTYRVTEDLVELCKIQGINKTLAAELYNFGVRTLDDVEDKWVQIETYGSSHLVRVLRGLVNGKGPFVWSTSG